MQSLTLQKWTSLAEIILTIITTLGILVSLYLSVRALREVQEDRRQRQRPHLAFEPGGNRIPIEFVKSGRRIPGVNPLYVEKAFPGLPDDAESVRIRNRKRPDGYVQPILYGELKNYGLGPALETSITWIPESISVGSEHFFLDELKLSEPRYSNELNTLPASPRHVLPGKTSRLTRFPTFIEKDTERKVSACTGVLAIACKDVFGESHAFTQEFQIFTAYSAENPSLYITFGRVRDIEAEDDEVLRPITAGPS